MAKRTYKAYTNTGDAVAGWPKNQTRYYVSTDAKTCTQVATEFSALTLAQKVIQTVLTAPAAATGKHWTERGCAPSWDTFVDIENSAFEPGATTPAEPTGSGFDTSYAFSKSGQDYQGKSFVSSPAPILTAVVQTKPRERGNWYNFPWQNGRNVALFSRFPSFSVGNRVIVYDGGLYEEGLNTFVGRGFTHRGEATKDQNSSVFPTDLKGAIEYPYYHQAWVAGKAIEGTNLTAAQQLFEWSSRASNGPDTGYSGQHKFITNAAAWQAYAEAIYAYFQQLDIKGAGIEYFSINQEVYVGRDTSDPVEEYRQWYRQVGGIAKALITYAAASPRNQTLKTCLTDHGGICHPAPYFFSNPYGGDNNLPEYMHFSTILEGLRGTSQADPISSSTDIGQLFRAGKAFAGENSYFRFTSDGQTLFQKNGTEFIINNGELVWRTDKRYVTISSQPTLLYKDDYYRAMVELYAEFAKDQANNFFLAGGQHLALSNYRPSGYELMRKSCAFRLDTEHVSGLSVGQDGLTGDDITDLNTRPLYGPWTTLYALRAYLFIGDNGYMRSWMETQLRTTVGGPFPAGMNQKSMYRGSIEMYQKGFQMGSNLNWISSTPYKPLLPKHWIFKQDLNQTNDKYEQFYRKPYLNGGLATKDGKPYIWLIGAFPAQDEDKTTELRVWIDKGSGAVTPSYLLKFVGREPFAEYWQLPDAAAGADAKHVKFQFKDLLPAPYQETITWTGDYREARITTNPTPPALAS